MNFYNTEEALKAIDYEADSVADAWRWLEREKPRTTLAIQYLIEVARMPSETLLERLNKLYSDSDPNAYLKMRLVIEAMAERE